MAKYVSEDRLLKLREHFNKDYSIVEAKVIQDLLNECKELNPWLPLEEFLKSGFEGKCWIASKYGVSQVKFYDNIFCSDDEHECLVNDRIITHVQPIHKPEPPR